MTQMYNDGNYHVNSTDQMISGADRHFILGRRGRCENI